MQPRKDLLKVTLAESMLIRSSKTNREFWESISNCKWLQKTKGYIQGKGEDSFKMKRIYYPFIKNASKNSQILKTIKIKLDSFKVLIMIILMMLIFN